MVQEVDRTKGWFYKTVGGGNRLIPKEHGLPLILRIHHRQIMTALDAKPSMGSHTKGILKDIDAFYGYNGRHGYTTGHSQTEDANPADLFWDKCAYPPDFLGEVKTAYTDLLKSSKIGQITTTREKMAPGIRKFVVTAVENWMRANIAKKLADTMFIQEVNKKFFNR